MSPVLALAGSGGIGPMEIVGLLLLAFLFVVPPVAGYRLGLKRGHEVMGLVLGLLLSWLGVLIMVFLPKTPPPAA